MSRPWCLAGCLLALACASSNLGGLDRSQAPGTPTTGVNVAEVPVRGHRVWVTRPGGEELSGELLAVEEERIWLQTAEGAEPFPVAPTDRVTVELAKSDRGKTALWSTFGCASTVTHGAFLIFTGPAWIATGVTSSVGARRSTELNVDPGDLPRLYQFARFPQGLPPGFLPEVEHSPD